MTDSIIKVSNPLEQAVQEIRVAQSAYDNAVEDRKNISVALADARVREGEAGEKLEQARNWLYKVAVRQESDATAVRVVPQYLLEGVDPQWQESGPVAADDAPVEFQIQEG